MLNGCTMAIQAADFDATLSAAAGDDPVLLAELRAGFVESLSHQVDLLHRARCDGNWEMAALRLRGLGASFHSPDLVDLSLLALDSAPGDPVVLRRFRQLMTDFGVGRAD